MMRQVSHKHIVLLHGVCVRDVESEFWERLSRLGRDWAPFSSVLAQGRWIQQLLPQFSVQTEVESETQGSCRVLSTNKFPHPMLSLNKCLMGSLLEVGMPE